MLETSEPKLNIQTIMDKIIEEINLKQNIPVANFSKINISQLEYIEALINNADFYTETPTKWPSKLNFFPFNFIKIQNFILKIYSFIFKKQKVVNNSLSQALKASLAFNQTLVFQVNSLGESLENLKTQLQLTEKCLSDTQDKFSIIEKKLASKLNQTVVEKINHFDRNLSLVQTIVSNREKEYLNNNSYLKNDLNQQKQLLTKLLDRAINNNFENSNPELFNNLNSEKKHLLDAFYVALEDEFRGTTEEITERLEVYLPLIEEVNQQTNDAPVLDVGCGRGEWLELLKDRGYQAEGIDLNRITIAQCQEKRLKVVEADVLEYLKSLPEQSLGAITGFHIIEHLPFEILLQLFSETVRVLKKGGIAIFETPNPQNILVASYKFYLDPTHLHPLPSQLIKFVAQLQGLSKIQILNLHPYPDHLLLKDSETAARFNEHFYNAQDYSVIGYKL